MKHSEINTKWIYRLLIVFTLLFGISQTTQASIVASVEQGSAVILNFDFTSLTPPPPYTTVSVDFSYDGIFNDGQIDNGIIKFYSELNGAGNVISTFTWSDISTLFGSGNAQYSDGVFSAVFSSTDGDILIVSATANATLNTGQRLSINAEIGNSIPEPSSLALVALALAGLRRKRISGSRI